MPSCSLCLKNATHIAVRTLFDPTWRSATPHDLGYANGTRGARIAHTPEFCAEHAEGVAMQRNERRTPPRQAKTTGRRKR